MLTVGFLLLVIIGYLIVDLLAFDLAWEEKIGLSYGVGFGFISLLMFLLLYFKLLDSGIELIILMLFVLIILSSAKLVVRKRGSVNVSSLKKNSFSHLQNYKLYLMIFPLLVISVWFSLYYPVIITDGNDYEATGRLIALQGTVDREIFFRPYPPLIPVAYSFVYFLGGTHPKVIFPFFYLSLIVCFYFRLFALIKNKKLSLIFTLILATTPYVWWHSFLGILNLTAAYYFSIATLFWFSHLRNISESGNELTINYSYPLLAGVFYGLSIFTRFEMLAYFLIPLILTALYSLKHRISKNILYMAFPSLGISSFWYFYSSSKITLGGSFARFPLAIIVLITAVIVSCITVSKGRFFKLSNLLGKCEMRIYSLTRMAGLSFVILLIVYYFIPQNMHSSLHLVEQVFFCIRIFVAKSVTVIVGNVFFLFTSLLVMLLLGKIFSCGKCVRERNYLFIFLLLYFVLNTIMFSVLFFSVYSGTYSVAHWNYDVVVLLKTIIYQPGHIINNTQIRGLLPVYPVIVFYFAVSKRIKEVCEV